jgi:hypothetical protein
MYNIICFQCNQVTKNNPDSCGTGYAIDREGNRICYECCGKNDLDHLIKMAPKEKFTLYFSKGQIINWPSSLRITPTHTRERGHNWHNVKGTTFWFNLKSMGMIHKFYGFQIGDNEIAHITKLKY